MSIGIFGNGFVGNALYQAFKEKDIVKVYDVNTERCLNTYQETIACEIVFVCLPTPMLEDGECDLSYVTTFFRNVPNNSDAIFVIKSTVPIGTTKKLRQMRSDLKIVHNPEFLTAANAFEDFMKSDRHIIGGEQELCLYVSEFYQMHFPNVPVFVVSSDESETIKYFCNSFLATKVALFNNLYEICRKLNMDYNSVRTGVCSDHRIGKSHSSVPGPDGQLGFGGYCFPKDINALISSLRNNGIDDRIFSNVWEYNKSIREEYK